MTAVRDAVWAKLYGAAGPLFIQSTPEPIQGWNSTHRWLGQAIADVRPKIVVEIGVWKGGSALNMAGWMRELKLNGVVICVDTWLGSAEHWGSEDISTLFSQFLTNVANTELTEYVVPLRLDSLNAARLLRRLKIVPEVIHLDAGHDYNSVFADLTEWWPMLAPGGVYLGDDYYLDGQFPAVKVATDQFFEISAFTQLECGAGKCRVQKSVLTNLIDGPTSWA